MKKIMIFSLLVAVISLIACDPIEDRDKMTGSITADQIQATVKVEQVNGKNVNKVTFECTSPINCQWTNGVLTKAGISGEMLMFVTGDQTITLTGICGDGSVIKKDFPVTVDDMYYDVAPEYGYFCGNGERTWTWDDEVSGPWGNGSYLGNTTPSWWVVSLNDVEGQASGKGYTGEGKGATMTFVLNGLKLLKSSGKEGTFSFDMSKQVLDSDGKVWSYGKLYTRGGGVLLPVIINDETYAGTFEILQINDDKLYLAAPRAGVSSAGGEATFWCFKTVN